MQRLDLMLQAVSSESTLVCATCQHVLHDAERARVFRDRAPGSVIKDKPTCDEKGADAHGRCPDAHQHHTEIYTQ